MRQWNAVDAALQCHGPVTFYVSLDSVNKQYRPQVHPTEPNQRQNDMTHMVTMIEYC